MACTDLKLCGSAAGVAFGGSVANWVNPGNATADDGSMATVTLPSPGNSNYLYASSFGFTIPTGRGITGISVFLPDYAQNGFLSLILHLTFNGVAEVGESRGSGQLTGGQGTVGGSIDLWGTSPSISQIISSSFGVFVQGAGPSGDGALDAVFMKVYYSDIASDSVPAIAGRAGR